MNILVVIEEINRLFDIKYNNVGFLTNQRHNALSFFSTQACWYYAYLLKKIFPKGDIYISIELGHVVFKYDNNYYDVYNRYFLEDEAMFFCDDIVIGSPVFDHPYHHELMEIINSIYNEINLRYKENYSIRKK